MTNINEAIERLERLRIFCGDEFPESWDSSLELALNGLRVIEKYTDMLGDCISESRDLYVAGEGFDDLVDCENATKLEVYCECSKMLHDLKWSIMHI